MKNKIVKSLVGFVTALLGFTAMLICLNVVMQGLPLVGVPKAEDISKVAVSCPELDGGRELEFSDAQSIDLAVGLLNFARYKPFGKVDIAKQPDVTVTYFLNDGSSLSLSAGNSTVWWDGKAFSLKQQDILVKLCKAVFFDLDDWPDDGTATPEKSVTTRI